MLERAPAGRFNSQPDLKSYAYARHSVADCPQALHATLYRARRVALKRAGSLRAAGIRAVRLLGGPIEVPMLGNTGPFGQDRSGDVGSSPPRSRTGHNRRRDPPPGAAAQESEPRFNRSRIFWLRNMFAVVPAFALSEIELQTNLDRYSHVMSRTNSLNLQSEFV